METENAFLGEWKTPADGEIVYAIEFNPDKTGILRGWELNRTTYDQFKWSFSAERNELTLITDGPPQSDFFADKPFTVIRRKHTTPDGKTHDALGLGIWMEEAKMMHGDQCIEFPAGLGLIEFRREHSE